MKRKIKFRFWSGLNMMNHSELFHDKYTIAQLSSPLYTPMQFTGLKDKSNKEVYEGDILSLPNGTQGVVEWLECGFVLRLKNDTIWTPLLFNVINHYEIIGNIYENPELINN